VTDIVPNHRKQLSGYGVKQNWITGEAIGHVACNEGSASYATDSCELKMETSLKSTHHEIPS